MTRFGTAREGWCAAICVILILAVGVGGGTSIDNGWRLLLFMGLTLAALLVAPRPERTFADLPLLFRIAIALTLILPAIQLIPLPPSIWQALPGRETEIAVLKLVGGADGWRPVTVDVFATLQSWFAIILAAAVGWLAWSGSARLFDTMRYAIFAIVLAATFFGYTQYLAAGAGYYLYDQGYHDDAVGFFSNRNHFGTMMAAVMPVAAMTAWRQLNGGMRYVGVTVVILLLALGALASESRAGTAVTAFALAGTLVTLGSEFLIKQWKTLPRAVIFGVAGVLVIALAGLVIFGDNFFLFERLADRFERVDQDLRPEIWHRSLVIGASYFPFGSGLGTFIQTYAVAQPITETRSAYINAAHNEYLQILLEAGLAGLMLLAIWAAAFLTATARILRGRSGGHDIVPFFAYAIAIVVFWLHSIVDYPIRMPFLALLFAIWIAGFLRADADSERTPPSRMRRRRRSVRAQV